MITQEQFKRASDLLDYDNSKVIKLEYSFTCTKCDTRLSGFTIMNKRTGATTIVCDKCNNKIILGYRLTTHSEPVKVVNHDQSYGLVDTFISGVNNEK